MSDLPTICDQEKMAPDQRLSCNRNLHFPRSARQRFRAREPRRASSADRRYGLEVLRPLIMARAASDLGPVGPELPSECTSPKVERSRRSSGRCVLAPVGGTIRLWVVFPRSADQEQQPSLGLVTRSGAPGLLPVVPGGPTDGEGRRDVEAVGGTMH